MVTKRSGRREKFNMEKLSQSIRLSYDLKQIVLTNVCLKLDELISTKLIAYHIEQETLKLKGREIDIINGMTFYATSDATFSVNGSKLLIVESGYEQRLWKMKLGKGDGIRAGYIVSEIRREVRLC